MYLNAACPRPPVHLPCPGSLPLRTLSRAPHIELRPKPFCSSVSSNTIHAKKFSVVKASYSTKEKTLPELGPFPDFGPYVEKKPKEVSQQIKEAIKRDAILDDDVDEMRRKKSERRDRTIDNIEDSLLTYKILSERNKRESSGKAESSKEQNEISSGSSSFYDRGGYESSGSGSSGDNNDD